MSEEHAEVNIVEAIAAMVGIARLTRQYYEALIDEGWSKKEAFRLTIAWQHAVAGGKLYGAEEEPE